jgi:hypothetical protein
MLPELPEDIRQAQKMGISLFAGEAEDRRLDTVLRDAFEGKLAPLYNHMNDLPALAGEPPPILPRKHVARTSGSLSSIDLGAAAPTSAHSARSSTYRAARAGSAPSTIWNGSFGRTSPRGSSASSSPMTISPATAPGNRYSTS